MPSKNIRHSHDLKKGAFENSPISKCSGLIYCSVKDQLGIILISTPNNLIEHHRTKLDQPMQRTGKQNIKDYDNENTKMNNLINRNLVELTFSRKAMSC